MFNELKGCQIDVPNLALDEFDEIFAVDGGSTDGTVDYLENKGIPVYRQPKRGLNAAYVHANDIATGDAVVIFFPKGVIPPGDLLKFRYYFESGYDLIIASRQISGSVNEEDQYYWRPRKWAVLAFAMAASLVWRREGTWIRDVLHGIKGFKRSAFYNMNILDTGLSIDIEMVIRAYKLQLSRVEFPTTEAPRSYGETHFKFWPTGKRLLGYLWFEFCRKD